MKSSALLTLLCSTTALQSAELDFYRDVYPFLKTNCISCHNKTTTKAGLNMETPELMIKGGDSGPSLVPGKSEESLVVLASSGLDPQEAGALQAERLGALADWDELGRMVALVGDLYLDLRTATDQRLVVEVGLARAAVPASVRISGRRASIRLLRGTGR